MNRRQVFRAVFATAVATLVPLPAVVAWKERLTFSDIITRTLKDPKTQQYLAESVMSQNALLRSLAEKKRSETSSLLKTLNQMYEPERHAQRSPDVISAQNPAPSSGLKVG